MSFTSLPPFSTPLTCAIPADAHGTIFSLFFQPLLGPSLRHDPATPLHQSRPARPLSPTSSTVLPVPRTRRKASRFSGSKPSLLNSFSPSSTLTSTPTLPSCTKIGKRSLAKPYLWDPSPSRHQYHTSSSESPPLLWELLKGVETAEKPLIHSSLGLIGCLLGDWRRGGARKRGREEGVEQVVEAVERDQKLAG